MSKSAIETMAKELRAKADPASVSPCGALPIRVKVELDEELSFLFLKLKEKWGLNNKEVMRVLLNRAVATEFPDKKVSINAMRTQILKKVKSVTGRRKVSAANGASLPESVTSDNLPKPTRYINIYQKRATLSETGGKCAYPGCNKPAVNFHHTDRFMQSKNHKSIKPLCKDHHEFPHNGLIENETTKNWQLNINGKLKTEADLLYRRYRQKSIL